MRNRTDRNGPTSSQGLACRIRHHAPRGFALVVTVSMLVLLSIIALGLLSLSAITLRSSSQEDAQKAAQANARMALMIAIGELQKQLGPDQRISASGEILDNPKTPLNEVKNPHWTGVWDSWIAGPVAAAPTKPGYPNTDSHHQTIGTQPDDSMRPKYAEKNQHFRAWLLSLEPGQESNMLNGKDLVLTGKLMPTEDETSVQLVAGGSLGNKPEDYVSAHLIKVETSAQSGTAMSGRYGWWIGDESQKARISNDSYAEGSLTSAEKIFRSQAPDSTGTSTVKGLETITAAQDKRLAELPSLCTLDVVQDPPPANSKPSENFHHITTSSYQVLADVREGGLKRDLSTLLERPIKLEENTDEFMLYAFDDARWSDPTRPHSRVPIQDLAAYYQLYEDDPISLNGRQGGVAYDSSELADSIQLQTADYDSAFANREKYLRDYTGLYRKPVPIKVQFLMAAGAEEITDLERTTINNNIISPTSGNFRQPLRVTDTHKLKIGLIPVVTLWNPFSVPIVMRTRQVFTMNTPPFAFRWRKYRADGTQYNNAYFNLNYCMGGNGSSDGRSDFNYPRIFIWIFSKTEPVVFEPGEVKLFSMPSTDINMLKDGGERMRFAYAGGSQADLNVEPVNEWDPFGFFVTEMGAVAPSSQQPNAYWFNRLNNITPGTTNDTEHIVFGPDDKLSIEIVKEDAPTTAIGRNIGCSNETYGAGFNFHIEDRDYFGGFSNLRHYQFLSRYGGYRTATQPSTLNKFNGDMITLGFPGGTSPINHDSIANAIPGSVIIGASELGEVKGVMEFSLAAGCEVATSASGGYGGGRKFAMRPFLHGSSMTSPFIDQLDKPSLYNYGWNWQVGRINDIEDSIIQGDPGTGNGYFGGGYTVEAGTTHVVQQDIPVVPPISIAALSHARLGGFGLTNSTLAGSNLPSANITWNGSLNANNFTIRDPADADAFQRVTAAGQGGLAPHVMQAIGNSYAHPNIPADKAFSTWKRYFEQDLTPESEAEKVTVPFVDHSYLANKALWDEFFFSSITPQPSSVEVFGGNRTLNQVAEDFFFSNKPLPNRRMVPVRTKLSESALSSLLGQSQDFTNGMADKIAAHLMVEGGFNINSTSVEAWKVLLTSLKGKPVAYLDGGKEPSQASPTGTPVSPGALPAAQPIASGSITGPNNPPEQWKGGRELSDTEITELATAMVKQVKLRGPFLSMSEFVNRRLDSSNTDEMALKGALQAALDDPTVSINANFRANGRMLDSETSSISFAFPAAAKGPIAYGSAPYIDQADVLRNFAAQLAPRGDTFVIRTYGDALNASGKVVARAWCEAVVQRVPEYTDPLDDPHVKQADLQSASNKTYGRKMNMVSFRWLNPNEV